MDATTPLAAPVEHAPAEPLNTKQQDLLLDGLKRALNASQECRLFRWGKFEGLFPSRSGDSGHMATYAVQHGYLTLVRTESRGKLFIEWVRITPRGVAFIHEHDSPKAVLRELRELLGETQQGVPVWMEQARRELATATARFESRAEELLTRLAGLAERVEAALRRADTAPPTLTEGMRELVPWGITALEYLDRRQATEGPPTCPLTELFDAVVAGHAALTLPEFQDGLRRLQETHAVTLVPGNVEMLTEPEFAFVCEGKLIVAVQR